MEEEKKERSGEQSGKVKADGGFPWFKALLVALIIGEAGLLAYISIQRNKEGRELSSSRQKLAAIEEELMTTNSEFEEFETEFKMVKSDKETLEQRVNKLVINIEETKVQKQEQILYLQQQLEQATAEFNNKLKREKQISQYLRRKWENSRKNEDVLMKKVTELIDSKEKLEEQLKRAPEDEERSMANIEGVPLKEVVVTDTHEAPPSLSGTILIANHEVDPPFVIINIGSVDGVTIGDRFAVMKGKKQRGTIIVSKLYPRMAVADINKDTTKKKLKKNWKVVSE